MQCSIYLSIYLLVIMVRLAEKLYNINTLEASILISQRFFYQIYAEQYLELLLDLGVIDVGFFYECEKQWGDTATFIPLPSAVDMSDPTMKEQYALVCVNRCVCSTIRTAILNTICCMCTTYTLYILDRRATPTL